MNSSFEKAKTVFSLFIGLTAGFLPATIRAAPRYLRVNQVGYLPDDTKVAIAFSNDDLSALSFKLISAADGQTAFGPQSLGPDQGSYCAFAHNYRLDFSAFTETGSYKVVLSVGGEGSYYFSIAPDVYQSSQEEILKFFWAQRCGYSPLTDAPCHIHLVSSTNGDAWATDIGQYIDMSGGWHDAGDYIKFLLTTSNVLDLMLFTYRENKGKFADNYAADGTPGANGIPDILDEAKYGLDWVLKLHAASTKLYYQNGGIEDHSDGWRLPQNDTAAYGLGGYRPAYHGIGANIAGRSAAALAMACLIWKDDLGDDTYADTCWTAATELYHLAQTHLMAQDSNPDWCYNETTFYDDLELAAIELYKTSGEWSYLSDAVYYSSQAGSSWGWFDWGGINSLAHYELYPHADFTTQSQLQLYLQQDLNSNLNTALSNPFRVSTIYGWGSASVMTGTVVMCDLYKKLFPGDTAYDAMHDEVRDYLLGRNQWGVSWVVGLGDNYSKDPHHQIADITDTDIYGTCIEGPMSFSEWSSKGITLQDPDEYAAFQSESAVYHDDVKDWATNEPTIWQASLTLCMLSNLAPPTPTPTPFRLIIESGDYNGDGTSDIAIFRERSGLWSVRGITRIYFGTAYDLPVPGDYDGDGTTDIGIFRQSSALWVVKETTRLYYGSHYDLPVPGDYNGDGSCDLGIFRASSGLWAIRGVTRVYFGTSGYLPVPGDYKGEGRSEAAIFRPASGLWVIRNLTRFYFGKGGDIPVPHDYDTDGIVDHAVFRPSTGLWAAVLSSQGKRRIYFGTKGDIPVPANYDGDDWTEPAIFRPTTALWAIRGITRVYYGTSGDIPATR